MGKQQPSAEGGICLSVYPIIGMIEKQKIPEGCSAAIDIKRGQ
jgi:hypothetical protein